MPMFLGSRNGLMPRCDFTEEEAKRLIKGGIAEQIGEPTESRLRDRIDAIMNLTNGSLFVASGQQYWIMKSHEQPVHDNAFKLSNLLTDVSTVNAVINLRIKADKRNKKCHQIREQLLFFTQVISFLLISKLY